MCWKLNAVGRDTHVTLHAHVCLCGKEGWAHKVTGWVGNLTLQRGPRRPFIWCWSVPEPSFWLTPRKHTHESSTLHPISPSWQLIVLDLASICSLVDQLFSLLISSWVTWPPVLWVYGGGGECSELYVSKIMIVYSGRWSGFSSLPNGLGRQNISFSCMVHDFYLCRKQLVLRHCQILGRVCMCAKDFKF